MYFDPTFKQFHSQPTMEPNVPGSGFLYTLFTCYWSPLLDWNVDAHQTGQWTKNKGTCVMSYKHLEPIHGNSD